MPFHMQLTEAYVCPPKKPALISEKCVWQCFGHSKKLTENYCFVFYILLQDVPGSVPVTLAGLWA